MNVGARADDAARIQLLADAFDTVAAESSGTRETSTPRGPVAELAYRSMRAELVLRA